MKNNFSVSLLVVLLMGLSVLLTGCAQPGKTAREGTREQVRTMRVNNQEMMQDLNRALLINKPSKLSDKHIP